MAVTLAGSNGTEESDNGKLSTVTEPREIQPDAAVLSSSEDDAHGTEEKDSHESIEPPTKQALIPKAPDGGLRAWLQVLGGFIIYLNTW